MLLVLLGLYALQSWWFELNLFSVAIAVLVGVAVCLGNNQFLQKNKKDAQLRLSHEEIGRLARVAERERVARDALAQVRRANANARCCAWPARA